ncbi:MAG: hypothetical protein ACE363_15780 [Alphaproteobacteria bacterium]
MSDEPTADDEHHCHGQEKAIPAVFTVPLALYAMGDLVPGQPFHGILDARAAL